METTPIRAALEKAFEQSGATVNEETTPEVQSSGVESSASDTPDTSINDDAEQKLIEKANKKAISGDESEEDNKKLSTETSNQPGDVKSKELPQQEKVSAPPVQIPEDVPPFWKAEDKAHWSKVPPEVRAIVKKYEDGRNAALTRYKQVINEKIGQWSDAGFDEVFPKERLQALALEQKTPAQATAGLWAWNDYLETNPHEAVLEIMDRYEMTPEDLYNYRMGTPAPQQPPHDPRVDQLLADQAQAQEAIQKQQLKAQLDAFGSEAQNGKALRPYWNEVKPYIQANLPLVYAENPEYTDYEALHAAYERACYANPQVRTKLVQTNNQVKFSDEKTQRAKEAASASISGSSSQSAEQPKTAKTVRDALKMAAAQHGLR